MEIQFQSSGSSILTTLNNYVSGSGFYVFPVREKPGKEYFDKKTGKMKTPKEKEPYTTNGFLDASNDMKVIEQWHYQFPTCMWGLATGQSKFTVIDFDFQKDPNMVIPDYCTPTFSIQTAHSGSHLVYYDNGHKIQTRTNVLGYGIDVRAVGGYSMVPDSVIIQEYNSGSPIDVYLPYTVSVDMPIQPIPDELVKQLEKAKTKTTQRIELSEDKNLKKQLIDLSLAAKLLSGQSNYDFSDYFDWFEVLGIMKNYGNAGYEIAKIWSKNWSNYNDGDFDEQWDKCKPASEMENGKTIASLIYSSTNANSSWEDLDKVIAPIEWCWKGWLPKALLTLIASESGIGKSAVLLQTANSFITGADWPDGSPFNLETGSVLWCEAESAQAINLQRAKKWGISINKILSPLADPLEDFQLKNSKHKLALEKSILNPDIQLVIVDSLSGTDNSAEKSTEDSSNVKWLAELAKSSTKPILTSHHLRKKNAFDSEIVTLDRLRGASAIAQYARVVWAMDTPDIKNPEHKRLSVIKNNLGLFSQPLGVSWKNDLLVFDDAPKQAINETVTDKAVDLLLSLLEKKPKSAIEIEAEFLGAGISTSTMKRAKEKLNIVSNKTKDGWLWSLPTKEETPF